MPPDRCRLPPPVPEALLPIPSLEGAEGRGEVIGEHTESLILELPISQYHKNDTEKKGD